MEKLIKILDIEFPIEEVIPENFENVDALYKTITKIKGNN